MLHKFHEYIKEAYNNYNYSSDEMDIIKHYLLSLTSEAQYTTIKKVVHNSVEFIGNIFDTESEYKTMAHLGVSINNVAVDFIHNLDSEGADATIHRFNGVGSDRIKACFNRLSDGSQLVYTFIFLLPLMLNEDHNPGNFPENKKRYERYLNNNISKSLKPNYTSNTTIASHMIDSEGNYMYRFEVKVTTTNFKFINPLNNKDCLSYIKNKPESLESLGKYLDKKTLLSLIDKNPAYEEYLDTQGKLNYTKYTKAKSNPKRRQMEEDNQMYIFASKPKYIEDKDGRYTKDIEIEKMVPIDPYDVQDAFTLKMMKLRASSQGDTQVYCIWLPKDAYPKDELDKINRKEFTYLRKLIDEKKDRV